MLEIISTIIGSIILIIPIYIFGRQTLYENKIEKNSILKNVIIYAIIIILYTLIFLTLEGTKKTLTFCLLLMLTYRFLFNVDYGKSLIASIIYIIILIIPDLIVTILFSYIVGKIQFYNNISGSIVSNIFVSIIMISIIFILKKPLKKIIKYNFSTNKKIILVSSFTLISTLIFFYNLINTFRLNNDILSYLIVILSLIFILFILFKQKIENEVISKKYDDLLNIMKNYESDIEEQRIIVHENRNELMTIKSKINDKEKESDIIKYIDSILGDKVSSKMSKYSKFKYLPSNGIKGFFYYKFMEAEKRNIKVSVNISKKIENSFLGNLDAKEFKDLVRIIGVYLDNAIDASSEAKDKKLGIEIYLLKEDIELIISNTFENKINIEKIGIEKFTTKGKNHGHGLLLVKHILNRNQIFEANSEIKDNIYVQKLKIKSNK